MEHLSDDTPSVPANISLSEHSRVLLAIHRAMRADAERLIQASTTLTASDTATAARLGGAWALIVELIHDHHWTEDDVMYPFLFEADPRLEREAVVLEDAHVELDSAMARVSARLRLLAKVSSAVLWQDVHSRLVDDAQAFRGVLYSHLDHEEEVVVPAVDAMDVEERHALQRSEQQMRTYRHMRMAIPWVLANAHGEEEQALRALVPQLIGSISDHVWNRRFQQIVAPLYEHHADSGSE